MLCVALPPVIYNSEHPNPTSHISDGTLYANLKVIIPICLSILVLLGLIGVVLIVRKRSKIIQIICYTEWIVDTLLMLHYICTEQDNQNRLPPLQMADSPSLANLQNKQNRDQQYHAVRCQSNRNSNSNESGSYKAEGNGQPRLLSIGELKKIKFLYMFFAEYIEDICPYATFQLNKQTYSESSYSGNVYSGPYHSVRGSFVYHDVKPDGYQVGYCDIGAANQALF